MIAGIPHLILPNFLSDRHALHACGLPGSPLMVAAERHQYGHSLCCVQWGKWLQPFAGVGYSARYQFAEEIEPLMRANNRNVMPGVTFRATTAQPEQARQREDAS
jgi:hypothetical protein